MAAINPLLSRELVELVREDDRMREKLATEGSLFDGYHPIMRAIHEHNAARLRMIIADHGWPGESLVGRDGAEAAWRIAQHAIGEPAFQRRCLDLLHDAVERLDVPPWQAAYMEDRIRIFEGRDQLYGTQLDVGPDGRPFPLPIEKPEDVDARRASVGLEPLAERLAKVEPEPPGDPATRARRDREYQQWLRDVGWRT